jgi:hypothetical protein
MPTSERGDRKDEDSEAKKHRHETHIGLINKYVRRDTRWHRTRLARGIVHGDAFGGSGGRFGG